MNEETYNATIRSIIDEHTDTGALDLIASACHEQVAHIRLEQHELEEIERE